MLEDSKIKYTLLALYSLEKLKIILNLLDGLNW